MTQKIPVKTGSLSHLSTAQLEVHPKKHCVGQPAT